MPPVLPLSAPSPARPAVHSAADGQGFQSELVCDPSPTSRDDRTDVPQSGGGNPLPESGPEPSVARGGSDRRQKKPGWPPEWPGDLRATLARLVPEGRAVQPLPGGRSNQVVRVGDLVVKIHLPETASPLFPNDPGAETRALRLLGPLGLAPCLRASGPGWLCYDHLEGVSWRRDPSAAALALRRLHALAPLPEQFRPLPSGTLMLRRDAARVARGLDGLPAMPVTPDLPAVARPALVHGDAVPGNLIESVAGVRAIDWQCPGLGDPVDDLAAFLSPAMQALYRGRPLDAGEREAFLSAYGSGGTVARYRELAPLLHWRIAAHCLWRARRGDPGYAEAFALECALP